MGKVKSLEAVKLELTNWRNKGKARGRYVPSEIRKQVIELLSEYNVSTVLRELGLNGKMLKEWKKEYKPSEIKETVNFIALQPEPLTDSIKLPEEKSPMEESRYLVNNLLLKLSKESNSGEKWTLEGNLTFKEWKRAMALLS